MIFFFDLLLLCICIFPKINIIGISGSTVGIRIEDALIGIYVFIKLISFFKYGKIKIKSKKLYDVCKVFSIYIVLCLISTAFGVIHHWITPILGILFLIRKIEYFCLIFIGYDYIRKTKDTKKLYRMFNFFVLFHFVVAILQLKGIITWSFNKGEVLSNLTQGRISSTFNGAYEFSGFLLLFLPYYLLKIINSKQHRFKNILLLIIIIFCIYISESRTSLVIALILIVLIMFKESSKDVKKIGLRFMIGIGVAFCICLTILENKIDLKRFDTINLSGVKKVFDITWTNRNFDNYNKYGYWYGNSNYTLEEISRAGMDPSLYARVSHWMQMIDGWLKSPIIGLGASISGGAADGNYIRIIVESGILGLVTWMYLLLVIGKKIDKNNSKEMVYILLSLVLGATLIDVFEASKIMMTFWFMIGIAYGKEVKDENSKKRYYNK